MVLQPLFSCLVVRVTVAVLSICVLKMPLASVRLMVAGVVCAVVQSGWLEDVVDEVCLV